MITGVTRKDAALVQDVETDIFDLEGAYCDWVKTEPQTHDRSGVFHPSAVGMCARRGVYEFIRTERREATGVDDQEIFRIGHAVHHLVQTILGDLDRILTPQGIEFEFHPEIPYDPATDLLFFDFGIGGTADGLLTLHHRKMGWTQRGIIEIKSIGNDGFEKLRSPKPDHLMQANLYAFRFDAPFLWFWYYNKNNSRRKVYRRAADDKVLEEAIGRFAAQKEHVDNGTLPDREESYYMCPRCEYAWTCQPSTNNRIQHQKKLVTIRSKGFGSKK